MSTTATPPRSMRPLRANVHQLERDAAVSDDAHSTRRLQSGSQGVDAVHVSQRQHQIRLRAGKAARLSARGDAELVVLDRPAAVEVQDLRQGDEAGGRGCGCCCASQSFFAYG